MTLMRYTYSMLLVLCLIVACITGCEFDEPYVPDYAGSSTLTGQIATEPGMDLTGAEVFLRGQDSFADIAGVDGKFYFQHIPPGDYSLQVQKRPYLQDTFPVSISKSANEDAGDLKAELKGAISGVIPDDKLTIIHGEVELIVYVDGVPITLQQDNEDDLSISLSSSESIINIQAIIRITVYIDDVPYSATVQSEGQFLVEFVPPGIYNDISVRLNSKETAFPIVSGGTVVVKSGQTRILPPVSSTSY